MNGKLFGICLCAISCIAAEQKVSAPVEFPAVCLKAADYSFETRFDALILQPFANNLDYAANAQPFNYGNAQPAVSPSWLILDLSSDYHFGFDVGVSGFFHQAQSSLSLNWERYHTPTDTASFQVPNTTQMVGPFFEIGPDASVYKKTYTQNYFHFDEVSLDYGTLIQFGSLLKMNWMAGVSFTRILQHRFTQFSDLSETIVRTLTVPAKFTGAGPELGFDFTYKIVKGFHFVGNTRAALLVGTFENSTTYTTSSQDLVSLGDQSPNVQYTTPYNKGGMVPAFEGRLGLAYEVLFSDHYRFNLEAGYQVQLYLNALRSTDLGSEVTLGNAGAIGSSTTGVYARTFQRTVSDFGMAGPYASVNFDF